MKNKVILSASLLFLIAVKMPGSSQATTSPRPRIVSVIQLIATPAEYQDKRVTVFGFLALGEHPEFIGQEPVLYMHEEDARNLLMANSIVVVPSVQMRREREKIDQMYVRITGKFSVGREAGSKPFEGGILTDIESCTKWSDPHRPVVNRDLNTLEPK